MSQPIKFFDRLPCVAGVVSLGTLAGVRASFTLASGAPSSGTIECTKAQLDASGVVLGACAEVSHPRRGRSWWIVTDINDATDQDRVPLTLSPVRSLLGRVGTIRQPRDGAADLYEFTPGYQTVRAGLDQFVLSGRERDGFGWLLGVGDIAYTSTMDVGGTFKLWTYEQYLQAVERATRQVFTLRPSLSPQGQLLGFLIDLRPARRTDNPLPLYEGPVVKRGSRAASLDEGCSVVLPVTDSGDVMGPTVWRVASSETTSPAWITLVDPSGGDAPIAEDGQFVGAALELPDGSFLSVLASRESDSAVQVARPVPVGGLLTLYADTTGRVVTQIESPSALARPSARIVRRASVARSRSEFNGAANADFRDGVTSWRRTSAGGRLAARARSEPELLVGELDASVTTGATALSVTGLEGQVLHRSAVVQVPAWEAETGAALGDASGIATIPVDPPVPAGGIANGTPLPITLPDNTTRNTIASGTQTAGATSVVVSGLPVTPALAIGQTLVVTEGGTEVVQIRSAPLTGSGVVTVTITPVSIDLVSGTSVAVTEAWRVWDAVSDGVTTTFVPRDELVTTSATVNTTLTAGGSSLSLDFGGMRSPPPSLSLPGAPAVSFLSGSFAVGAIATRTYTTTSAPAWSATREATVGISPNVVVPLPAGATITWSGGADVELVSAALAGASTLVLRVRTDNALPAGGTIRLAGETLYVNETTTAPSSGVVSIPLFAGTAGAIAAGRAVQIVRLGNPAPDEPGSANTLQLDALGLGAAAQVRAESSARLFRVVPGVPVTLRARAGVTTGGVRQTNLLSTWRISIGAATQSLAVALPITGAAFERVHSTLSVQETLSATAVRSMGISAEKQVGPAEFDYRIRWAMLTVSADPDVPFTPGAFSNSMLQAGNAVLRARRTMNRLRIGGVYLRRFLDENGLEDPMPGQRVRVYLPDLKVYEWADIVRVTYYTHREDEDCDLGSLDPQLSFVTVQ